MAHLHHGRALAAAIGIAALGLGILFLFLRVLQERLRVLRKDP